MEGSGVLSMKTATVHVHIDTPTASGQRKGWWKKMIRADRDQAHRGGFSLVGEFIAPGIRAIEVGSVLVRCEPTGSQRRGSKRVTVKLVTPKGASNLRHPALNRDVMDLKLEIDLIHELIEMGMMSRPMVQGNPLSVFSNDELVQELNRRGYVTIRPGS